MPPPDVLPSTEQLRSELEMPPGLLKETLKKRRLRTQQTSANI